MNDYRELHFKIDPFNDDLSDYLSQQLADVGFESFVVEDNLLKAFIPDRLYSRELADGVVRDFPLPQVAISVVADNFVEGVDWNAEWEKNYFKPIVVADKCVIHSSFHKDIPSCEYDIVIDPKMAFGTGHHSTTSLIIRRLLNMNLAGKRVMDMGTGTGILAILAAMLGASEVDAIEIDPVAWENACENVRLNSHAEINVICGDASALASRGEFDIFLANITRNIIIADMQSYAAHIRVGGSLILSGFYSEDAPLLAAEGAKWGMRAVDTTVDNGWCSLLLVK